MTYYVCVAIGMADCYPNEQLFISAEDQQDLRGQLQPILAAFDDAEDRQPYCHPFHPPINPQNTNWSQRLRISNDTDLVLDVIGMSREDWQREARESTCCWTLTDPSDGELLNG